MSHVAIRAEGVGKEYRLVAGQGGGNPTLATDMLRLVQRPFRRLFRPRGEAPAEEGRSFWAVRDVSFEVRPGEVLGIIGRNGSGKSTMLKILSRITPPTTGHIEMHGRVAALLEVGTGFHPELTGRENVYLNGILLGMRTREIDRKLDEIVEFAGVERFIDTPVKRYSSGMYVRLAFSVAAHLDTEILLLDEVLAVGDALFQRKCLDRSMQAARSGRTVIIVSHNLQAIQTFCTRGLLFDKGQIQLDQSMGAVVRSYAGAGVEQQGEQEWPDSDAGPHLPDRSVRLTAIRALGADGKIGSTFDVTESFVIEVEFRVIQQRHSCSVHLYFRSHTGQYLFVSMDNVDSPWMGAKQPPGLYRGRVTVPGNLLNEGNYHIEYLVCTNPTSENYVTANDALVLTVADARKATGARGDWEAEWPTACIRPALRWEHEVVEESMVQTA